jgi:hypothetical protein
MNQKSVSFKTVAILDRNLNNSPVKALEVSLPTQWQSSGGIFWDGMTLCPAEKMKIDWQGISDRAERVQMLSTEAWQANSTGASNPMGGSLNLPLTTIKEYLESFVCRHRPNSRILGYSDRSDLIADLQYLNRSNSQYGNEFKSWIQAGQILICYDERGCTFEEIIMAVGMFQTFKSVYPGIILKSLSGSTNPGFAMRAPVGKLNLSLAETIRQSVRIDANWQMAVVELNRQINQVNQNASEQVMQINHQTARSGIDEILKRHQTWQKTNNYLQDLNTNNYQQRQAARDQTHHQSIQTIRGVATYYDPYLNKDVELPNTYNTAWRLKDLNGTHYMTDDPSFDPYRNLGVDGYRLQRKN